MGAEVVEGENEIRIDDSFKVKFNLPIDESSFTSDSVKLINKDTEEEIELMIKEGREDGTIEQEEEDIIKRDSNFILEYTYIIYA